MTSHGFRGHKRLGSARFGVIDSVLLRAEGRLESAAVAAELERCLVHLHASAIRSGHRLVTVDVTDVTWASEECVRVLVKWAMWISEEPAEKRYALSFRIDHASAWQRGVIATLETIVPEIVEALGPTPGRGFS